MVNLLENGQYLRSLEFGTEANGVWQLEINASSDYSQNGLIEVFYEHEGSLTGTVEYALYDFTGTSSAVWFIVMASGVAIFSRLLREEGDTAATQGSFDIDLVVSNEISVIGTSNNPNYIGFIDGDGQVGSLTITATGVTPEPPSEDELVTVTSPALVYEFEKGWSFDGNYIPHFVELNWYFGDNPVDFRELSNVRVHGLTKGNVQLSVSTNGMETDSDFYAEDYSEPQIIDLPRKLDKHVTSEYVPVTNYEQPLNRGIAVQMKFEGRNEDLSKPEPSHVLQVLVTQSSPVGNGNRSN